ncbi:MAG: hypothetical protein WA160_14985 [Pseudobdellovibrio sp.]
MREPKKVTLLLSFGKILAVISFISSLSRQKKTMNDFPYLK